jgi:hypothetical protein
LDGIEEKYATMTPNKALIKTLAGILVTNVFIAVLLFVGAGRLNWKLGWLFVVVWGLLKIVFILLLRWHDPALLGERATRHENTQPYYCLIVPVYFVFSFSTIFVAGLDGGRFRWSGDMSVMLIIIAYVFYLFGNFLASWAVSANPFFHPSRAFRWIETKKLLASVLIDTSAILLTWPR